MFPAGQVNACWGWGWREREIWSCFSRCSREAFGNLSFSLLIFWAQHFELHNKSILDLWTRGQDFRTGLNLMNWQSIFFNHKNERFNWNKPPCAIILDQWASKQRRGESKRRNMGWTGCNVIMWYFIRAYRKAVFFFCFFWVILTFRV